MVNKVVYISHEAKLALRVRGTLLMLSAVKGRWRCSLTGSALSGLIVILIYSIYCTGIFCLCIF